MKTDRVFIIFNEMYVITLSMLLSSTHFPIESSVHNIINALLTHVTIWAGLFYLGRTRVFLSALVEQSAEQLRDEVENLGTDEEKPL